LFAPSSGYSRFDGTLVPLARSLSMLAMFALGQAQRPE
jgi:hypothetical protein